MKKKGFTLIELMIVVSIICILVAVLIPAILGHKINHDYQCIGGYEFTYRSTQILDQNGHGIPCEQQ